MTTVNILEAKNSLSSLVERVASGQEREITITRHGRPVARLVPLRVMEGACVRLGAARGKFVVPESINVSADEAAVIFTGSHGKTSSSPQ